MSYLLDRKAKRNRYVRFAILAAVLILVFYFQGQLLSPLGKISGAIFRPVLLAGRGVAGGVQNLGAYFYSKKSLTLENEKLKQELFDQEARMANFEALSRQNAELQNMFARKPEGHKLVLAGILSDGNENPYGTIIIDAGEAEGIKAGDMVYGHVDVPIGRVSIVSGKSSKVNLFSTPEEKTQVVVPANIASYEGTAVFWELIGRGGGNFEMILPRDFALEKGNPVLLPGLRAQTVAITESILSDPRDAYKKALLKSPVNTETIDKVLIEIK